MDWQSTYRIALSLIALLALAGAAWLVTAPEPSPGAEISQPTPAPDPAPPQRCGPVTPVAHARVAEQVRRAGR